MMDLENTSQDLHVIGKQRSFIVVQTDMIINLEMGDVEQTKFVYTKENKKDKVKEHVFCCCFKKKSCMMSRFWRDRKNFTWSL